MVEDRKVVVVEMVEDEGITKLNRGSRRAGSKWVEALSNSSVTQTLKNGFQNKADEWKAR